MADAVQTAGRPQSPKGLRPKLVGQSPCMQELKTIVKTISSRICTVLIYGETGSGKEMVARQIHSLSPRASKPFIPIDCTTLRDTLFESQLFGHVKGAFTGADRASVGFFRAADSGTLFFDEIGELQPHVQAKLLRCIQDQAVVPLGGITAIPVDVRIIAATLRDLKDMVRQGQFREDLYFRLNVINLKVPPLRERQEDVLLLADYFLQLQAEFYDEPPRKLDPKTQKYLLQYSWPGNVRELANVIERAFALNSSLCLDPLTLPEEILNADQNPLQPPPPFPTLAEATRHLIIQALNHTRGRKLKAAELLGIERRRFNRILKNLKIQTLSHTK
jgi:DNA-binding NtrC family response regulator